MFNHKEIEAKWQKYWEENQTYRTENKTSKPKFYALDMFPYPSGAGLHVGHPKGYTANDILARYKHAKGFNVLHPMGWDAFGLPAENYAIKTGTHPRITTDNNINTFRQQIKALGFSYDWNREVDTTDPKYYKWTQWIFLKLFEKGLAYEQDLPINYCPSCKTGLANEEVLAGFYCERCGDKVMKKKLRQWVLAITKYADRLAQDVEKLDWPKGIKDMQTNWIGRSEGCEFELKKTIETKWILKSSGEEYNIIEAIGQDLETVKQAIVDNPQFTDKNLDLSQYYIAKKWDEIISYGRMTDTEGATFINSIFTKEEYRGNWIGVKICKKLIADAKHDEVFLDTTSDLIPYYEKIGMQVYKWESLNTIEKILNAEWDKYTVLSIKKEDIYKKIRVYTTRVDTVFGMSYAVIAPDHKDVHHFITPEQKADCEAYVDQAKKKSDQDRTHEWKEKTGVFTGSYVTNPYNGESVPLWVADYVLGSYGTWAVMAVPAHDERDFEFAQTYNIPNGIRPVFNVSEQQEKAILWEGILENSGEYDGITTQEARKIFTQLAEDQDFGEKKVNYKLRDRVFSRQRYWGEPIPLIHLKNGDIGNLPTEPHTEAWIKNDDTLMIGETEFSKIYDGLYGKIVCDYRLPLELPEVEQYEPAGDGHSPLALVPDFVNVELAPNLHGQRETNTMPQWGGSCWYYLRYMDPDNVEALVNPEVAKYWGEVDSYVGGAEHAVLHLLYARFWHKFLFDIGVVPTDEPFYRLRNQGLILGPDGEKMSKSKGNVINPDDIIAEYGADTLRMYEMYMADFKDKAPWDTKAIVGVHRFLDKVYKAFNIHENFKGETVEDPQAMKNLHKAIKKVGDDIENYKFNTAIAALMILIKTLPSRDSEKYPEFRDIFLKLLHPFAPFLAEELWQQAGHPDSIFHTEWPNFDETMLTEDMIKLAVSINGKPRVHFEVPTDTPKEEVIQIAKNLEDTKKWTDGKEIVKEIYVPGKLVNIVIK